MGKPEFIFQRLFYFLGVVIGAGWATLWGAGWMEFLGLLVLGGYAGFTGYVMAEQKMSLRFDELDKLIYDVERRLDRS